MSQGQPITRELSLGDVISKTFQLYRSHFLNYVVLFAVVEAIMGALTTVAREYVKVPPLGTGTPQQIAASLVGLLGAVVEVTILTAIVTLVFIPISYGGVIKMASQEIETGVVNMMSAVRSAVSRLLWIWVVGIIVGIIVSLGTLAFVVPGIILSIMFSLIFPIIIIEKSGLQSMGRSRQLVSQRWLKTFALFIVFGLIVGILAGIIGAITAFLGVASTIVSDVLSALYLPLIPIMLTVYYYSNVARISASLTGPPPVAPPLTDQTNMMYCPNCGTQLASGSLYCPSCGTKLS